MPDCAGIGFECKIDLAQTARSPGQAATGATRTARASNAGNDPEPEPAAAATSAAAATPATDMAAAATTAAAAAVTAAATMTTTTATAAGDLHDTATGVFFVEQIERGETDVGHFLFAEDEALIGRVMVGLRNVGGGHGTCRCAADQRKAEAGCTQHLHRGGFACAFSCRSWLDPWNGYPWHGRILQEFLVKCLTRQGCARRNRRARVTLRKNAKVMVEFLFIFMNRIAS